MSTLDAQAIQRILTLLSGAIKGISFYPASHPAIRQSLLELDRLLSSARSDSQPVSWGILDGALFFADQLFVSPSTAIADLINRMQEKEVGRITISAGVAFKELENFVRLFSAKGGGFTELQSGLAREGISRITLVRLGDESLEEQQDEKEDDEGFLATYGQALDAIRGVCRDIELGRIPGSAAIIRVVDRMVGITMHDPSTLLGLSLIKDYDNYTFNHCVNVGVLAMALGASIGLKAEQIRNLGIAGHLHDIGKTKVAKQIINKPGRLTAQEMAQIRRHPDLGAGIVRQMDGLEPEVARIVLGHHLHFNRSGYPEWARETPFDSMIDIMAIADTYDAITTLRVYQQPVNPRAALSQMRRLAGTLLDGALVDAFAMMMGKYPVGTLVRLDTNEVAMVCRPNPLDDEMPVVRILFSEDGERLDVPREQKLAKPDGERYATIVAAVDPVQKNIDVSRFVAGGNY